MGFEVIEEKIKEKFASMDTQRKENEVKNNEFQKLKNEILSKVNSISKKEAIKDIEVIKELFQQLENNINEKIENYTEISILRILSQRTDLLSDDINLFKKYMNFIEDFNRLGKVSEVNNLKKNIKSEFGILVEVDYDIDEVRVLKDRKCEQIVAELFYLQQIIDDFYNIKKIFNNTLPVFLSEAVDAINRELFSYRKLRNIADNALTEDFYNKAVSKYKKLEDNYRRYFYYSILLLVFISVVLFIVKNTLVPEFYSNTEFWIFKASIVLVGITLISYFIKQSSHYQRLADQNYQTQVELLAYPSFMESIPTEEAASVRRELALKYFGREIDGAAHKDMSNLISDQMKSTTDMVKATTEAIKNLK